MYCLSIIQKDISVTKLTENHFFCRKKKISFFFPPKKVYKETDYKMVLKKVANTRKEKKSRACDKSMKEKKKTYYS